MAAMGTFDANRSSSNYQKQAIAGAMQGHQRMNLHNRQYQERQRALVSSASHRRSPRSSDFPGDDEYEDSAGASGRGRLVRAVSIIAVVLGVGGAVLLAQDGDVIPSGSSAV